MRDTVQTKHNTAVWPVYNPTSPFLPTTTPSHIYCGFTRLLAHTLSPTLWIPLVWKAGPLSRGYSADVVGSLVTLSGSVAAQVWILPWESHAPPTRLQQQQLDSLQLLGLFIPPPAHTPTHTHPPHLKQKQKQKPLLWPVLKPQGPGASYLSAHLFALPSQNKEFGNALTWEGGWEGITSSFALPVL